MSKYFLSLISCFFLFQFVSLAQINNYIVAKKEKSNQYDSLKNVPDIDIKSLIGQTIFFPDNDKIKLNGGYKKTFYNSPTFATTFRYGKEKEVYEPTDENKIITKYDAIANKYFRISNIAEKKGLGDFCFELIEVEDKEEEVSKYIITNPIF